MISQYIPMVNLSVKNLVLHFLVFSYFFVTIDAIYLVKKYFINLDKRLLKSARHTGLTKSFSSLTIFDILDAKNNWSSAALLKGHEFLL